MSRPGTSLMKTRGPDDTKEYWKNVLRSTGQDLPVSGLRYASGRDEPLARRILWVVLILGGLIFMFYQITESFMEYYSRPVSVGIDEIYPDSLEFPVFTICNENRFVRSKVKALGIEKTMDTLFPPLPTGFPPNYTAIDIELTHAYNTHGFSSYEQFLRNISFSAADVLAFCLFSLQPCNHTWFDEVWTDMGVCFQLNPAKLDLKVTEGGSNYGLYIFLDTRQSEYVKTFDGAAGFRMAAQTSGEYLQVAQTGVRVDTGALVSLTLQQQEVVRLEPPYGNCSTTGTLERGGIYSKPNCKLECIGGYISRKCGCVGVDGSPLPHERVCTLTEELTCLQPAYLEYVQTKAELSCTCDQSCTSTTYDMIDSSNGMSNLLVNYFSANLSQGFLSPTYIRENYAIIYVYFPTLSYTKMESRIAYTTTMLFNDLGGALGLMLGSTFFTIYEIFDILIWAGWFRYKQKRRVVQDTGNEKTNMNGLPMVSAHC